MPQRTMLQFSTGALLLLLPWFRGLVVGESKTDFSKCLKFFYKQTPPVGITGNGYQPICQFYKGEHRYATLYLREHRRPLYSAYILDPPDTTPSVAKPSTPRPTTPWKYEPQLVSSDKGADMLDLQEHMDQEVIHSQAVVQDYLTEPGFTRGHLNPKNHHKTEEDRDATFTLTNIFPQKHGSNSGPWNVQETKLREFKDTCKGTMYVITGVIPYESEVEAAQVQAAHWISDKRVSVPEYIWLAYCCQPESEAVKLLFPAYAAIGRNDDKSDEKIVPIDRLAPEKVRGYDAKGMSLADLETLLKERLKIEHEFSLFKGQCN